METLEEVDYKERLPYRSEQELRRQLKIPRYFDIIRTTKKELDTYDGIKVGVGRWERILYGFQTRDAKWWMIVRKPIVRCPACQKRTSSQVPQISFRRYHHHDHQWKFYTGIPCSRCGYAIRVRKSEQYHD